MKKFKDFLGWFTFNSLFMWAVVSACIFGSAVGYNFMTFISCAMLILLSLGFLGLNKASQFDREKFNEYKERCKSNWHPNKYVDFLYDVLATSLMVYAGFLGVSAVYATTILFQMLSKKLFEEDDSNDSDENKYKVYGKEGWELDD